MNRLFRSCLFLLVAIAAFALTVPTAYHAGGIVAAVTTFLVVNSLTAAFLDHRKHAGHLLVPTFTVTEILQDVIDAFIKEFPALQSMGMDFQAKGLKLNKTYTAHVPTLPSVSTYDTGTGYANGASDARSLFADVDVKVDNHKFVPLKFLHLDAIKDDKAKYEKAIGLAGYVLAKAVIDAGLAKVNTRNFSQESVYAQADCDLDAFENICGDMNLVGALGTGRVALINTPVATVLGADTRVSNSMQYGQRQGGNAYRRFVNIAGFAEILEYPDLPTNNGSILTGIAGEADTEVITKAAHGLKTGDPIIFPALTGGSGLTAATVKYWAIRVDANNFKPASSYANAIAGTAVNFTTDITDGSVQRYESLAGVGMDMRALSFLGGIPEGMESELAKQLGIPAIASIKAITYKGITMAAVGYQQAGTLDLFWAPVLVFGWRAGKEDVTDGDGADNTAGTLCDYAGHRLVNL